MTANTSLFSSLAMSKHQFHGEGTGDPLQYSCLENPMYGILVVWDFGIWESGRLQSMGSLRVRHDFAFTFTFHLHALEKEMATHSSVLPGESQGRGSLVGCRLWGRTELDTTDVT